MTGVDFLDTNILVYAYDATDQRKQRIAQNLVNRALAGEFVISTQVLGEFASTLLHKVEPRPSVTRMTTLLDALAPIRAVLPDGEMVRRAVEAHGKYGIRFYDGMIVAAAERAGCKTIWSEDLNAGQEYFSVLVANPF
jgi:predicted nucleic acid-binding protein